MPRKKKDEQSEKNEPLIDPAIHEQLTNLMRECEKFAFQYMTPATEQEREAIKNVISHDQMRSFLMSLTVSVMAEPSDISASFVHCMVVGYRIAQKEIQDKALQADLDKLLKAKEKKDGKSQTI